MSSSEFFSLLCAIFGFLHCHAAIAGTISLYDESRFLTFTKGREIYGYYSAHNELFYCGFFFVAKESVRDPDGAVPVETFNIDYKNHRYTYDQLDRTSFIRGVLSKKGRLVSIRTEKSQAGCQSAAGLFSGDGGLPYTEVGEISGVGVGVVNRKSFIHRNHNSIDKNSYLLPGDAVAVIERKNDYSYIRYVNPDMLIEDDDKRHVSTGWIRSPDLVDPLPPANNQ